jgi:hypothetical protein
MENKYKKVWRLAKVYTKNNDGTFEIILTDNKEYNYGPYYASEKTFDSEEEAIEYALGHKDWMYSDFTLIPVYSNTY